MRLYKMICLECGREELRGARAKYCTECIKKARKSHKQAYQKHVFIAVSHDTDAMRSMCLSCTRPKCTGNCAELAQLVVEERNGV